MNRTIRCAALSLVLAAGSAQADNRTIDGSGNNLLFPTMGQTGTLLSREASGCHYADGVGEMLNRPSPRAISNALSPQNGLTGNARKLTSMHWQWGQFIDHDFALVAEGTESAAIAVPAGDPWFDPVNTGVQTIAFKRSQFDLSGPSREHANTLTHWIDGSMVYGSDATRAAALRDPASGRLLVDAEGFMPRNTGGLPNAGGANPDFFLAGDVRSNEQVGLTSMHTLFVREHNYWADRLAAENPAWTSDEVYERARKIVGAEVQAITYNEYLPALLGGHAPGASAGYDANVDGSISTSFSTAAFRLGHTMLNDKLLRRNEDGTRFADGHLNLFEQFFNPDIITEAGSMDAILRGLAGQEANELDTHVIDGVRNMLFGPPGAGGLDLISLNLQRGRDHGLADFNTMRQDFGLAPVASFGDITSDPVLAAALGSVYSSVDEIDPWIGLLAEDHLAGASVGETLAAILVDQFTRLRDADRYFYAWDSDLDDLRAEIDGTLLSDIIMRNTDIASIRANVFVVPAPAGALVFAGASLGVLGRRRRRA